MTLPAVHQWNADPAWPRAGARGPGALTPEAVGPTPEAWLARLPGPTLLRIPGRDRTRTRALVTLLHGNEPSGFRALHAWLRRGDRPAVDLVCFVGAVEAARAAPGFALRMLPGRRDLNRCFAAPGDDAAGTVAAQALTALRAARPELLIDVHNNTGHNPAYGVGTRIDPVRLALTGLFATRFVLNELRLGTLVEATDDDVPSMTIECGRAGDPAADACALAGIARYAAMDTLGSSPAGMRLYGDAVRVHLAAGLALAFGSGPVEGVDLTLAGDIDRHNFETLPPGVPVGWVGRGAPWPLVARGADGRDVARVLFRVRDGLVETARTTVPIMMTTDPRAATGDCLFYVVRERPPFDAARVRR